MKRYSKEIIIILFLVFSNLLVFGQVVNHEFINYDDRGYVTDNPYINNGWSEEGVRWAFTTKLYGHYHPLTWLSHMTDCQFFGLHEGLHHLSSLFLHILNTILLFLLIKRITGATYRSAAVAVLFSLHPLHVEPVAFIASRKDLLSALFWILTMWAYILYINNKSVFRYLTVLLFFLLGLMSKAMIITLPLVLLLIDYWPLGRFNTVTIKRKASDSKVISKLFTTKKQSLLPIVMEKIVLFIIVPVFAVIAVIFMQTRHDLPVNTAQLLPSTYHISNALLSYISYMGKMLLPLNLVNPYPFRDMPQLWQVLFSLFLLLLITFFAVSKRKSHPYLITGWLWYIVTLLPMIGLLAIGPQAVADRYSYIPTIGLSFIIVWGTYDLVKHRPLHSLFLKALSFIVICILIFASWRQTGYWKNSFVLFERTVKLTQNNPMAHYCLGYSLELEEKFNDAEKHYKKALDDSPGFVNVINNLGGVLIRQGKATEAATFLEKAIAYKPDSKLAHLNLANALAFLGKDEEALIHYKEALRIKPDYETARLNLGVILIGMNKNRAAISQLGEVLKLNPESAKGHYNMGRAHSNLGKRGKAIYHYRESLKYNPQLGASHINIGAALYEQGEIREAIKHYEEALRIDSESKEAHYNLGLAYLGLGKITKANMHFAEAEGLKKKD